MRLVRSTTLLSSPNKARARARARTVAVVARAKTVAVVATISPSSAGRSVRSLPPLPVLTFFKVVLPPFFSS